MSFSHIFLIALIQGLTEWLPVSSSAHLALLPVLTRLPDQGLLIDAMAHLGTLLAGLVYFRADLTRALLGCLELWRARNGTETLSQHARLALHLIIATPPALIAGAIYAAMGLEVLLRHTSIIAAATIGFALVLWWTDQRGPPHRRIEDMHWREAFLIGCAQICALIPGASRSGVTMSAARGLGFTRSEAARFAMLMGIPILGAAGGYSLLKLLQNPAQTQASLVDGLWVAGLSFIAAMLAIRALLAILERTSFLPFVVYRLGLGVALLLWAGWG